MTSATFSHGFVPFVSLENFVRPFAAPNISPPAIPPQPLAPSIIDVICSLGGDGGQTVSVTYETEHSTMVVESNNYKESGRRSSKVHVENEDDPDQFVDFCRADKLSLTKKNKGSSASKQSSYDPGGSTASGSQATNYSFEYPTEKTCKSKSEPPKGCGNEDDG